MSEVREQRLRLLWLAGIAAPVAMVLLGGLIAWLGTGALPDLGRIPSNRSLLIGVATGGASMGMVTLLPKSSKWFEQALRESGTRVGEEALRLAGYPVMLVVVTMAGLGEEVLFRGGLQPMIGILPAALLFGFSHGGWRRENWAYVIAAALSGLLFGLAYQLTGDLWVPVIAHALHNLLATLLLGRRVEVKWHGLWPVVRLVPEEQEVRFHEPVDEPVPTQTDSPDDGAGDRDLADRPPE